MPSATTSGFAAKLIRAWPRPLLAKHEAGDDHDLRLVAELDRERDRVREVARRERKPEIERAVRRARE